MTRLQLNKPSSMFFFSFLLFFFPLYSMSSHRLPAQALPGWFWFLIFLSLFLYHLVSFPNQDKAKIFGFLCRGNLQRIIFKITHYDTNEDPAAKTWSIRISPKANQNKILAESKRWYKAISNINALTLSPTLTKTWKKHAA